MGRAHDTDRYRVEWLTRDGVLLHSHPMPIDDAVAMAAVLDAETMIIPGFAPQPQEYTHGKGSFSPSCGSGRSSGRWHG